MCLHIIYNNKKKQEQLKIKIAKKTENYGRQYLLCS